MIRLLDRADRALAHFITRCDGFATETYKVVGQAMIRLISLRKLSCGTSSSNRTGKAVSSIFA